MNKVVFQNHIYFGNLDDIFIFLFNGINLISLDGGGGGGGEGVCVFLKDTLIVKLDSQTLVLKHFGN